VNPRTESRFSLAAKHAGISDDELARLCILVRAEFPADEMLYETHVIGLCVAIEDGVVTIGEVLDGDIAVAA
jgi:hypothetical protein